MFKPEQRRGWFRRFVRRLFSRLCNPTTLKMFLDIGRFVLDVWNATRQ